MGFRVGEGTRTGANREVNQDFLCADSALGLFVVADGAGGLEHGDIASRLTVQILLKAFQSTRPNTLEDRKTCLVDAIQKANRDVAATAEQWGGQRMASTVVAVTCQGPDAIIAHVGDSRCYRLRGGALERLTDDHTIAAELARAQGFDEERAAKLPFQNVLSRALGASEEVDVAVTETRLQTGDLLLLCSDGVSGAIPDADLRERMVRWSGDLDEAAGELIAEARARGTDDVTALLFEYGGRRRWSRLTLRAQS